MELLHVQQILKEIIPATLGCSTEPEARRMRRILLKNPAAAIGCAQNLLDLLHAQPPPPRVICRSSVDPHAVVLQMLNILIEFPPKVLPLGEVYSNQLPEIIAGWKQLHEFPLWFAPGNGEWTENLFGLPADVAFEPQISYNLKKRGAHF